MHYSKLDYCAFEHTFVSYCKKSFPTGLIAPSIVKPKHENIDRFILLPAGLSNGMRDEYLGEDRQNIAKGVLSDFRNHNKLYKYIINGYLMNESIDIAEDYFRSVLKNVLIENDTKSLVNEIYSIADTDFEIPKTFIFYLEELTRNGEYYRFLSETFVFSIVRDYKDYSNDYSGTRLSPIVTAAINECKKSRITSYVLGVIDMMYSELLIEDGNRNTFSKHSEMFSDDDAYALAIGIVEHIKELDADRLYKIKRIAVSSIPKRLSGLCEGSNNFYADELLKKYGLSFRTFYFNENDELKHDFDIGDERIRLEYSNVTGQPAIKITGLNEENKH